MKQILPHQPLLRDRALRININNEAPMPQNLPLDTNPYKTRPGEGKRRFTFDTTPDGQDPTTISNRWSKALVAKRVSPKIVTKSLRHETQLGLLN
jgi:hypothetical protein